LRYRIAQVKADPSVNPWLLRPAVLRSTARPDELVFEIDAEDGAT